MKNLYSSAPLTHARVNLTSSTRGARHRRVACPCCFNRFTHGFSTQGVVYLKSAELGMTHLDSTEWENAKYRKSDFFIRCGRDNAGICGIE
ncbi:hypothetical protein GOBAR_AA32831 [Gossypium barbadense]|uniref:Uncharacterized protein n=1 Tax=Gossypium barbadense TaxID=3634 RepID=A0A2P5W9Z9_GOSBA|nr:hypothetical protein GOBAR_AA32831 [Gossypium barbadense]